MRNAKKVVLWVIIAISCVTTSLAASDAVIRGTVTDSTGKPIRGALVKASTPDKSVSRFSQKDGRYEITVPAGTYDVSVDAYGYALKRATKDTVQAGDTNFSLSPRWDVTKLTGAEVDNLVPETPEGKLLKSNCIDCHDLSIVMRRRGQTAAEWKSFLPNMTAGRRPNRVFTPAKLDALSAALEKYFGPNSQYFGPDADPPTREQVKHPELSDATLKATIREYNIPSGVDAFAHSIFVDPNAPVAWFSEIGLRVEKLGRFDMDAEKFTEYPLPPPEYGPHSGVVGLDGTPWFTLENRGDLAKLISLDPHTGKLTYYKFPDEKSGAHTVSRDHDGNLWLSGGGNAHIWFFDVKKGQFKEYKFPLPEKAPEDSVATWERVPGEPEAAPGGGTYHVSVDSKNTVWGSSLSLGMLINIDPRSGETAEFKAPGVPGIRGILVDQHDIVWFSDYFHHRLGKFDPKTGAFKLYQPPTLGAAVYGIAEDKKTGYIWYADHVGGSVTRFDPKTETFAEYPLPTRPSFPRFIDVASNGKVWFTEYWNGKIGVVDTGEGSKESASR